MFLNIYFIPFHMSCMSFFLKGGTENNHNPHKPQNHPTAAAQELIQHRIPAIGTWSGALPFDFTKFFGCGGCSLVQLPRSLLTMASSAPPSSSSSLTLGLLLGVYAIKPYFTSLAAKPPPPVIICNYMYTPNLASIFRCTSAVEKSLPPLLRVAFRGSSNYRMLQNLLYILFLEGVSLINKKRWNISMMFVVIRVRDHLCISTAITRKNFTGKVTGSM